MNDIELNGYERTGSYDFELMYNKYNCARWRCNVLEIASRLLMF